MPRVSKDPLEFKDKSVHKVFRVYGANKVLMVLPVLLDHKDYKVTKDYKVLKDYQAIKD